MQDLVVRVYVDLEADMVFKIKSLVFIFLRFFGLCVAKYIMGINILYEELGYVFIFNNIFESFNVEII